MSIYFRQELAPEGYALGLLHRLDIPAIPPINPLNICKDSTAETPKTSLK